MAKSHLCSVEVALLQTPGEPDDASWRPGNMSRIHPEQVGT
jgi:hypothetical protein